MFTVCVSVQYVWSHVHPSDMHGCFTHLEFTVQDVWQVNTSPGSVKNYVFLGWNSKSVRDFWVKIIEIFHILKEKVMLLTGLIKTYNSDTSWHLWCWMFASSRDDSCFLQVTNMCQYTVCTYVSVNVSSVNAFFCSFLIYKDEKIQSVTLTTLNIYIEK